MQSTKDFEAMAAMTMLMHTSAQESLGSGLCSLSGKCSDNLCDRRLTCTVPR